MPCSIWKGREPKRGGGG